MKIALSCLPTGDKHAPKSELLPKFVRNAYPLLKSVYSDDTTDEVFKFVSIDVEVPWTFQAVINNMIRKEARGHFD